MKICVLIKQVPDKDSKIRINSDSKTIDLVTVFAENVLGKGVVICKDVPNFIGNRLWLFSIMSTLKYAEKYEIKPNEVDAITGSILGRPKSATFRTADIVGLDTMCYVANTGYEKCPDDPERDAFKLPDYIKKMVDNKWLGQKTKQGFYKKIDKGVIHSLDLNDLIYKPMKKK